jgi:TRAP transporter 4TM/12TM fusion protein
MSEQETSRTRQLPAAISALLQALGFILVLTGTLYALQAPLVLSNNDIFRSIFGQWFSQQLASMLIQQFYGLVMAISLFACFMLFPMTAKSPRNHVPWYDYGLGIAGAAAGLYIAFSYQTLAIHLADILWHKVLFGAVATILTIEACRRIFGWILPIIAILFILYAAYANHMPGMLQTNAVPWNRLAVDLLFSDQGMLGFIMQILATIVLIFVVFGSLLFAMGGGTLFTDLATAAMGKYRGGPAKVAVVGSAFFGSISNSAVANVVITGSVTIPMMKRIGYKATVAGAIEATASTGGLVTPPVMSAVAFVMAEYLQMPYGQVIVAAAIPAILYYGALILQVDLEAGKTGMKGLPPEEIPSAWDVLQKGWAFLLPLPALIYTLVWLLWQPEKAGAFAILLLLVCGYWYVRDKPWRWWYKIVADAGVQVTEIIVVGMLVGIILGASSMTGLSFTLTEPLLLIGEVSTILLLISTAIISLILGMGLPGIAIYFMQVALIVPALVEFGITKIAAHFFIFYYGVFSLITPPVAVAAMAASTIAKSSPWDTGVEACKMGIVAFIVPFVFVFSPSLLAQGPLWLILTNFCSAALGVVAIAVAMRGFFMTDVSPFIRLLFFASAIGLFLPVDGHHALAFVNVGSFILTAMLLAANYKAANSSQPEIAKIT